MNAETAKLAAGLYLVAVPIGSARDITLRALDILASADMLAAEDTRSLRRLMDIHGIALGDRPLLAYHDHSGQKIRARLMEAVAAGKSVAYASEAGTPLIADPGYDLARQMRDEGLEITSAPGPSAVITALSIAGLPTDRFLFAGFLPSAAGARKSALMDLRDTRATLVFYESPNRIATMLGDAAEVLGPERQGALCRELTKRFEEVRRGTLSELAAGCETDPPRGEIVLLVDRGDSENVSESDLETSLSAALERLSVRDAADEVAARFDLPRRKVYQMALKLNKG
ncbi:16S rRNA (cytidine1402-2'-O)-methyltransferase [Pseudooceanicola antarcticus]|uniref:Ribosomal RNA small subunit methyltransferase I n=1 Tax=Pseudooceanicola antarcticus TaxID=1247613 RepID=A0A285IRP3_9RHOB|nr:16S rRNA (cytidine(1402)-2'-O)-methyltransferase [Pseudooceanicola antarcticus]PJE31873.1 16S rRNA (cytidine(1402)-2'-O)-methyltransferase [Pseudooceanicola antarcticus]SNY50634.1 16S rRNA (cytidine1402-2'-O)-methyltransferase [Pseudooceanicola antarcticus]